jgi:hypothetical protein
MAIPDATDRISVFTIRSQSFISLTENLRYYEERDASTSDPCGRSGLEFQKKISYVMYPHS